MNFWPFKTQQRADPAAGMKAPTTEQGNGLQWLVDIMRGVWGGKSAAGVHITEDSSMSIAAVFTAVRIISSTIASLPLQVYRRASDGGREVASRHWAYPLLHDSPNEYHTAFTWNELIATHLLLWGNSYSRIEWLGNGSAGALYPLRPWDVTPKLTSKGVKYYQVRYAGGSEDIPDDEMLHVPGLSYDGMQGISIIGKQRDTLGLAKAADNMVSAFFANGAKVGGILEVPGKMDPAAQKNLVESLSEKFAQEGAFKTIVLEGGAKLHGPNMMPLRDAQFIEGKQTSRSEIFGLFGIPPHLGGDTNKASSWGTGIEQMDIGFAKHTIRPWCVRIEQEINRKLFRGGSGLYCKYNLDALMRGDFKTRMEGLQLAVGGPWMSREEAREFEDMNKSKQPDMDKVLQPLNLSAGSPPAAKPTQPAPAPAPAQE